MYILQYICDEAPNVFRCWPILQSLFHLKGVPHWSRARHNDAAEIAASLLILDGGDFFSYQTEVKNKPHQIEKKPDYHTAACGKSTLDNMTAVSNYFINTVTPPRQGVDTVVWCSKQGNSFSRHAAPYVHTLSSKNSTMLFFTHCVVWIWDTSWKYFLIFLSTFIHKMDKEKKEGIQGWLIEIPDN